MEMAALPAIRSMSGDYNGQPDLDWSLRKSREHQKKSPTEVEDLINYFWFD